MKIYLGKVSITEDNCHVDLYQKDVNEQDLKNAQVAYWVPISIGWLQTLPKEKIEQIVLELLED